MDDRCLPSFCQFLEKATSYQDVSILTLLFNLGQAPILRGFGQLPKMAFYFTLMGETMFNNKLTVIKTILLGASLLLSGMAVADMTGKWALTVETPQGSGNPSLDLVEKDGQLTGTYTGMMGSMPVTGTIENNAFKISYNVEAQGMAMTIEYNGALKDDGTIEGKMKMGDFGEGAFTGKKQ